MYKRHRKERKSSFTPSTSTRTLKRTTPARSKVMGAENGQDGLPADSSKTMEKLFKDLGSSLTESLTKKLSEDFKSTMTVMSERVDLNAKKIEQLRDTVKRIERNSTDAEKRFEAHLERIESAGVRKVSTSSLMSGEEAVFHDGPSIMSRCNGEINYQSEAYQASKKVVS